MGRNPGDQPVSRVPRHRRRRAADEAAGLGPDHQHSLDPWLGRLRAQGRLCRGQARARRSDQGGRPRDCRQRHHGKCRLPGLGADATGREADRRHCGPEEDQPAGRSDGASGREAALTDLRNAGAAWRHRRVPMLACGGPDYRHRHRGRWRLDRAVARSERAFFHRSRAPNEIRQTAISRGWEITMVDTAHAAPFGSSGGTTSRRSRLLPSRLAIKRAAFRLLIAGGIAAATGFGHRYWTVWQYQQSTDDAFVQADFTTVAPKVSGYIAEVLVQDNDKVEAGRVLARIDDRDFRTALDQTRADVAAAIGSIQNIEAEIVLQQSVVEQGKAAIAATEASLKFAAQDQSRYHDLMTTGYGTVQRAQQTDALLRQKTAQLQSDRAALVAAQQKIAVLATERTKA